MTSFPPDKHILNLAVVLYQDGALLRVRHASCVLLMHNLVPSRVLAAAYLIATCCSIDEKCGAGDPAADQGFEASSGRCQIRCIWQPVDWATERAIRSYCRLAVHTASRSASCVFSPATSLRALVDDVKRMCFVPHQLPVLEWAIANIQLCTKRYPHYLCLWGCSLSCQV